LLDSGPLVVAQFPAQPDWLRSPDPVAAFPATVTSDGATVTLSNGLITRVFTISPNWFTSEYRSEAGAGTSFLRGVSPRARVFFDASSSGTDIGGVWGSHAT
jgi:hypothetical protein